MLAAGGDDGSVFLHDIRSGETKRSRDSHARRITQLKWVGNELVTSSADGSLRGWTSSLSPRTIHSGTDPIPQFAPTQIGWFVVRNRNQITSLDSAISTTPLQLSNSTTNITSSADLRYLSWSAGDSVTVIDTRALGVSTLSLPSPPEKPCMAFGSGTLLHYCRSTEEIATIDVSRLDYVPFTTSVTGSTTRSPR